MWFRNLKNRVASPLGFRMAIIGIMLVGFAFSAVASAAETTGSGCPKFPSVPWWKGLSHASVSRYVKVKNGGNWGSYIKKWTKQLKFLKKVYDKGGAVNVAGYKLKGSLLKTYINKVTVRLSVTSCLAGVAGGGGKPASGKAQ